jgi:putative transport protein
MWKEFSSFLIANPIISIFLALAGGYFIGKFKIKSFSLGSTVGVLLVGLLVGQLGIFTIAPILKSVFFDLFIFVVGYEVGPAFIQS